MFGHLVEFDGLFELRFIIQIDRRTRDVATVIGDAFQDRGHFRDCNNKPEISGGRLSQGNNIDALPIDFYFNSIDCIIMVQYAAGEIAIAFYEGTHCSLKRSLSFPTQQQHAISERIEFVVKMSMVFHVFISDCRLPIADLADCDW
jgi:hypothetical protein